jgi:hypothetical protein
MWQVNEKRGEGFLDSFSYCGNILQQGTADWRKKDRNDTVIEHRVQSTNLTQGPSIWLDEGGSCLSHIKHFTAQPGFRRRDQ